jgi:hypothetical protein
VGKVEDSEERVQGEEAEDGNVIGGEVRGAVAAQECERGPEQDEEGEVGSQEVSQVGKEELRGVKGGRDQDDDDDGKAGEGA